MKRWTITLEGDGEDLILPLPPDLLEEVGWKTGDLIEWTDNKDGTWSMKKKATMGVKMLHIHAVKDPLMWYANKAGENVQFVREDDEYYWSRDNGGYLNIVHKTDAIIVEV